MQGFDPGVSAGIPAPGIPLLLRTNTFSSSNRNPYNQIIALKRAPKEENQRQFRHKPNVESYLSWSDPDEKGTFEIGLGITRFAVRES
jgi:hypothetical protein